MTGSYFFFPSKHGNKNFLFASAQMRPRPRRDEMIWSCDSLKAQPGAARKTALRQLEKRERNHEILRDEEGSGLRMQSGQVAQPLDPL